MEQLCRNGKHPIEYRITQRNGSTRCQGCRDESRGTRARLDLNRMGAWSTPVRHEERAQALKVWAAGVDAAIEEIRRTEGFDGSSQTWQTFDPPLPARPPAPPRPIRLRLMAAPTLGLDPRNGRLVARTKEAS